MTRHMIEVLDCEFKKMSLNELIALNKRLSKRILMSRIEELEYKKHGVK
jgi:hypothetical protein